MDFFFRKKIDFKGPPNRLRGLNLQQYIMTTF